MFSWEIFSFAFVYRVRGKGKKTSKAQIFAGFLRRDRDADSNLIPGKIRERNASGNGAPIPSRFLRDLDFPLHWICNNLI